ncbi:MAG TPA: radical SAM protein [Conexivisphaerales archaeon]|nr:radical SAM protein [Conexivisphaerales archaeon]
MPRLRRLPAAKYAATAKYVVADYSARDFRYPFYCSFKVIQRCDSRCDFCNVWRSRMPDLPKSKVLKVIDNVADSSVLLLSLEGGEPLLRSDIGDVLEYVRAKPLYLLFTTSGKLFDRRPMKEYSRWIDFLHVSIDEGHGNMDLYESLGEFVSWGPITCVQIVVTKQDLPALEEKVRRCHLSGAKAVVMPACRIPGTPDYLPEMNAFRREVSRLKLKYPGTIITTDKYLRSLDEAHACNAASIIVDADGRLCYPCRTLMDKSIDASEEPLMEFLSSRSAAESRERMRACSLNCHWYQYFATDSFLSPRGVLSSLRPYLDSLF